MLAGPLLVRSQSHFSQASVSEYVEDSEPEREERRSKIKPRQKKTARVEAPIPPLADVIELTDSDDVSYHLRHSHARSPQALNDPVVVIDVSESSDDSPSRSGVRNHVESQGASLVPEIRSGTVSGLEDATTDDSFPSIREVLNLPPRAPRTNIATHKNPSGSAAREPQLLKNLPSLQITSPLSPPRAAARTAESSDSEDRDEGSLKLRHFAYVAPNPPRRTASKTPSPTEGRSVPPEAGATGKAKRPITGHRFTDFSDAQLLRVLKCVSCDLAWTARKTVAQKMKHIQTCAKKNGLADDTVRSLLRKELDGASPTASSSKSTTPASAPDALPETLLENVIKDTSKKKPGRRLPVLQTVKSVEETRELILDRARSLLANGSSSRVRDPIPDPALDLQVPPATQVFGKSSVAVREDYIQARPADATQVFGASRLAGPSSRLQGAIVRAGAEIAAHSDISPLTQLPSGQGLAAGAGVHADEAEAPPCTQVFARSKLTNANGVGASRMVVTSTDIPDDPISIHDTSEDEFTKPSPVRPIAPHSPPSSSAKSRRRSRQSSPRAGASSSPPSPRRRQKQPASVGETGQEEEGWAPLVSPADVPPQDDDNDHWNEWIHDVWEDDGACLHYVPETQTEGAGPSGLQKRKKSKSPPRRRLAAVLEDALAPPVEGTVPVEAAATGAQVQAKKKRRKKVVGEESEAEGKTADVPQEELNVKMKEALLKDKALHLRVLRYEPIHFDVFLQMALDMGMSVKRTGLKAKVRTFLDQKAIHFYGADPSKSRTRRTRHP
ncbi:hypothetical protein C2E23DRAFT_742884 [Lenzites betulinus]|nr:hypothetical protein C2E23DRAFT_742884 [Lenzites betulinus]